LLLKARLVLAKYGIQNPQGALQILVDNFCEGSGEEGERAGREGGVRGRGEEEG
jgi:hypothetical protein